MILVYLIYNSYYFLSRAHDILGTWTKFFLHNMYMFTENLQHIAILDLQKLKIF